MARQLLAGEDIDTDALYNATVEQLEKALKLGLNIAPDYEQESKLYQALNMNIANFSQAKTLFQIKHFKELMFDDGKLLPLASFKKVIADQGEIFNQNYLHVEYDMVVQSAVMANKWETMDAEYLQFTTVGDDRVRPEHKLLDKFTAKKSDPIWKRLYTPLAWGCRCGVIPGKATLVNETYNSEWANKLIDPYIKNTLFDNNVGISKEIFTKKHPYFK